MSLVLRDVEVDDERVDVRVEAGLVAGIGHRLKPADTDDVIEGLGGALIPGLHDHHVHLLALAAARQSLCVGPPDVRNRDEFLTVLRRADAARPPGTWIRAVGYHENVGGPLDRHVLDAAVASRPVRVQHRSGALWILNTAAINAVGLEDEDAETGRLFRRDEWLAERLGSDTDVDLAAVSRELASYGVTGVTDASPSLNAAARGLLADGTLTQHFMVMGRPGPGPVKLLLHDHALPSLDTVVGWMGEAHRAGLAVAVHCVTRESLVLTLAALDEVGAVEGDRIEHGAVIPPELIPTLKEMGLTVVTQPSFVAERGDDYLADVDPGDQPDLWRCRSLLEAGVGVAGSTDAPFGHPNPWRAIAAAAKRRTLQGRVLGDDERLPVRQALDLFLTPLDHPAGPVRTIRPGAPADLCLLAEPLEVALRDPAETEVAATIIAGRRVT